jgi:hypothetical protein
MILTGGKIITCDNPGPVSFSPPLIQHGLDGWSKHCLVYSTHSGHIIVLLIVSIVMPFNLFFMPCFILGTKIPRSIGFVDVRYSNNLN